jgi:cysteine desulfurase
MTGLGGQRVYLDWNATAPLRPQARAAMLQAMDAVGNPSSVHAEGRAARAIVERARGQVAALVGCDPDQLVFTSGATEANHMALGPAGPIHYAPTDHPSVVARAEAGAGRDAALIMCADGRVDLSDPALAAPPAEADHGPTGRRVVTVAAANGETGVVEDVREVFRLGAARRLEGHCDATQAVGRTAFAFRDSGAWTAAISAHKLGGPKGVGAFVLRGPCAPGADIAWWAPVTGGGQEQGRRPGTENVVGIAGFGTAAEAARRDLEDGVWERVAMLRDSLEARLESAAPGLVVFGRGAPRLPNTSCFALPGWPGETQVMQMDLAGFAVSAGSACSSGKVERASRVLLAMGVDEVTAASAIRVSLGPTTTEAEVAAFADAWMDCCRRRNRRAA